MISKNNAEIYAVHALGWMVQDDDVVMPFLAQTGVGLDDVKARAGDPEFLASVIDFILSLDQWVMACADAIDIMPEQFVEIRAQLPGGNLPNWT